MHVNIFLLRLFHTHTTNMSKFFTRGLLATATVLSLTTPLQSSAQKVDTVSSFSITGYIDAYYAYSTDSVGAGNYQKFPTVSPLSNSPGLNIAQVSVQYTGQKIRAVGTFHYGDIANSVWANPYNNIQEAHIGFKVCNKLWVDGGFFRSHFGTELLTPAENIASSLTVGTYYEPYYQSGIRLAWDPTSRLSVHLYLIPGYKLFIDNNNKPSAGIMATYAINEHLGITYTNYIGDDAAPAGTIKQLRFHNNAFLNYQKNKFRMQVGADYCMQQNSDIATHSKTKSMYSALATFRYQCAAKLGVYVRGEMFSDPEGYMSTTFLDNKGKATGYKLVGGTAGAEFKPTPESYIKLEGRFLQMDKDQYIYYYNSAPQNARLEVMLNAGITFDMLRKVTTRTAVEDDADESLIK